MKKIIAIILLDCLFISVAVSQSAIKTCIIKGDLGPIAPYVKKIFIQYRDAVNFAHGLKDSSDITDGKYAFTLKFQEPAGAFFLLRLDKQKLQEDKLVIPQQEETIFEYFLDAGNIFIKTDRFPFSNSVGTGSIADKQYQELSRKLEPVEAVLKTYDDSLSKSKEASEEMIAAWMEKRNAAAQEKLDIYIIYLNNKKSRINAHIIRYALNLCKRVPLEKVKSFYQQINSETKEKNYCKILKDFVDFTPGIDAPLFVRTSADGKIVNLGDYGGKYVLLDFWGSWCKPCRERHPELIEIYNRYKEKNFEIIGVAKDGDPGQSVSKEDAVQKWMDAIKTDALPWVNVLYKGDDIRQAPLDETYRVISYPSNYLIDPKGKIIAMNLTEKELGVRLAELLK